MVHLPGTTILPGFIDSHVHLTGTGVSHQAPEIAAARSATGLLEAIRRVVASRDGPTIVHGYDESRWDLREPPSLAELDGASDQALAVVRIDGHLSLANTPALEGSGVFDCPASSATTTGRPTGQA